VVEKVVENALASVISSNSQFEQLNRQQSASNNGHFNSIILNNQFDFRPLINKINKQIRYKNHLAIFKIHTTNNTTPSSLFFDRYPPPLFREDEKFIDSYNALIREMQKRTIDLTVGEFTERLEIVEEEIINEKDRLQGLSKFEGINFQQLWQHVEKVEGEREEFELRKNRDRANRCENKEYTASCLVNFNSVPTYSFYRDQDSVVESGDESSVPASNANNNRQRSFNNNNQNGPSYSPYRNGYNNNGLNFNQNQSNHSYYNNQGGFRKRGPSSNNNCDPSSNNGHFGEHSNINNRNQQQSSHNAQNQRQSNFNTRNQQQSSYYAQNQQQSNFNSNNKQRNLNNNGQENFYDHQRRDRNSRRGQQHQQQQRSNNNQNGRSSRSRSIFGAYGNHNNNFQGQSNYNGNKQQQNRQQNWHNNFSNQNFQAQPMQEVG
jgi:hypothetical protein